MLKQIMGSMMLCVAIVVMRPLYAQHTENTLGSLWPEVEKNYPGVKAKTSAIDAAKLQERVVRGDMLPQVKAQVQNTYGTYEGNAGAFFPQPGFFNVSGTTLALEGSSMAANSFGSATMEWELFSFGRLRKENEAAHTLFDKTISEKDAYLLYLKKTLSERYITLLYHDAKLDWAIKNTERLDDIRKITSGLSASGMKPAADSLLASSSYMQAMGEHDKWYGLTRAAFVKLSELYGNDNIDYKTSSDRFNTLTQNLAKRPNSINPSHPILDAWNKQSEYYTHSAEAQKRSTLPSLRLLGGYAYRGTGLASNGTVSGAWKDGFNNTANNFLVGIGITWNISNLHTGRLKSEKLFKDAESSKQLQIQYGLAMQTDLSATQTKIHQQYKQLDKTRLAVKQSRDAYDMYLARYKSGLIALSELLQIRSLLEQAENAHIEASRDYWMLLAYEAELTADFYFLFNNL